MISLPIREIAAPLFALLLFVLGAAYFTTFSILYFKDAGSHVIGALQSSYYTGMFIASCLSDGLILRIGPLRTFALATLVAIGGVVLMGCCSHPLLWGVMRFFGGASIAVVYIIVESWLLSRGNSHNRGKILAIYMIATYVAQSLGQNFIEVVTDTLIIPFLVTILFMASSFLPVLRGSERQRQHVEKEDDATLTSTVPLSFGVNLQALLRLSPFGVAASFFSGMTLAAFYSFAPLFALEHDLSIALLMGATTWGAVAFQLPMGWLSDRIDRRLLLTLTSALMVAASLTIGLAYEWLPLLLTASFLFGGCAFTVYPQSIVVVVSEAPGRSLTAITAIQSVAYSVGSMMGPILVALFTTYWAATGLYAFIATASLLFTAAGILLLSLRLQTKRQISELAK